METYYNEAIECMPRDELIRHQNKAFLELVDYVVHRQPLYRKKLEAAGVGMDMISGIECISLLPFTDKKDISESYPFGMQAADDEDIIRINATSGTGGRAAVIPCTAGDVSAFTEGLCRALVMQGCGKHSKIQNTFSYSMFIGGIGIHNAAEKIGATVIPTSVGNTARQLRFLKDFRVDCLAATPSYALHIFEKMKECGISPDELALKTCFVAGEVCTDELHERIETLGAVKVYNVYGNAEMTNVFASCRYNTGMHIPEDMIYAEIVDEKGQPLPAGAVGELVITTLAKRGLPLVRYNTHDLAVMQDGECPCGRTGRRVRILGRSDDMIIVKGCKFFPSDVERLVSSFDFLNGRYRISRRNNSTDTLIITAELKAGIPMPQNEYEGVFERKSREMLGAALKLELVPPDSLKQADGNKASVFSDRPDAY